jgi:hypothetical protein
MTNVVDRFVREAILRQKLRDYAAMYRLDDGKYYSIIVSAYNHEQAERMAKRRLSDWKVHEFQPNDYYKELIESHDYLYVFYIGKED